MKRLLLAVTLVAALLLITAQISLAAPIVSLKTGAGAGLVGAELEIPYSSNCTFVLAGGYIPGGAGIGVGSRQYFQTSGWMPFLGTYLQLQLADTDGTGLEPHLVPIITGGIARIWKSGFKVSAELGLQWVETGMTFAWGFSTGFRF